MRTAAHRTLRPDTIVCGLEHFIDKIGYQAAAYRHHGIRAKYIVVDKSGLSRSKAEEYGADVVVASDRWVRRLVQHCRYLLTVRPPYVELYDIGRATVLYALIAKLVGSRLILILRGAELWGAERGRRAGFARHAGLKATLTMADAVVAKEENIMKDLVRLSVPGRKVHFLGNAIPIPTNPTRAFHARSIDVLFLNSIKKWRHVPFLIRMLKLLHDQGVSFRAVIAGFTTFDQTNYQIEPAAEREAIEVATTTGSGDWLQLKGFVSEPHLFHQDAKIFVLPADIIFANYSLLESMSAGAVPIVANGEGAARIVDHGTNGYILEKDPQLWANTIREILTSPRHWASLSHTARSTISCGFSIDSWVAEMIRLRQSL